MTNVTLSHEIRNPLNSIVAFNMQKDLLYKQLIQTIKNETLSKDEVAVKVERILATLNEGKEV